MSRAIEEAQWFVAQCIRDLDACTNYKMVPIIRQMLAKAKEELAYAIATNRSEV